MKHRVLRPFLWLLLCLPALAHAQAYKCRQPDGSQSFQDRPCAAGEASTALAMPPPSSRPPATALSAPARAGTRKNGNWDPAAQNTLQDSERQRLNAEMAAQVQQLNAQNRMMRCNFARRQLGALQSLRPAWTHDNQGERHYIEDDKRGAETATWQQAVARDCN